MTHTSTPRPFAQNLFAASNVAIAIAQDLSDRNGSPVGVWTRDGWFSVDERPPDDIEPDPEAAGWRMYAVVDPTEAESLA